MTEELIECKVVNGYISNAKQVMDAISSFVNEEVEVLVRRKKKYRTPKQNNYLHGVLFKEFAAKLKASPRNPLPADVEITPDLIKEICKFKFALRQIVNKSTGDVIGEYVQDTSDFNTKETIEFVEQVIHYAASEYHIQLPFPSEQLELPNK